MTGRRQAKEAQGLLLRQRLLQGLLLKDWRIADIAADLGFAEPGAFIRTFKAWAGTTPAANGARRATAPIQP